MAKATHIAIVPRCASTGKYLTPPVDEDAVVEEIGAQKVALVGHSMGGDAIVFAARQLVDRVVGLVWVDAFRSLGTEPVSTPEQVDAFVAPFREDFPSAVDQFVRNLFPPRRRW